MKNRPISFVNNKNHLSPTRKFIKKLIIGSRVKFLVLRLYKKKRFMVIEYKSYNYLIFFVIFRNFCIRHFCTSLTFLRIKYVMQILDAFIYIFFFLSHSFYFEFGPIFQFPFLKNIAILNCVFVSTLFQIHLY